MVFPGDEIFALGHVQLEPDPHGQPAGFREPPARPVLRGTGRMPLLVTDADRPSFRRAAAWELGKGALSIAAAAVSFLLW